MPIVSLSVKANPPTCHRFVNLSQDRRLCRQISAITPTLLPFMYSCSSALEKQDKNEVSGGGRVECRWLQRRGKRKLESGGGNDCTKLLTCHRLQDKSVPPAKLTEFMNRVMDHFHIGKSMLLTARS